MHTKFKVLVRAWALTLSLAVVSVAGVSTSAMAQTAAPVTAPAAAVVTEMKAEAAPAKKAEGAAVENPYGIVALWTNAHSVDMGVLIMLGIMSMGSWYILAIKMLEQAKAAKFAREAADKFWGAGTVAQGAAALHKDSPDQFIAAAGVDGTQ